MPQFMLMGMHWRCVWVLACASIHIYIFAFVHYLFFSNLDKSLSCAKNGLEGCLQSQVDTAAVTLSSKKNLNTELSYCKSSTGLANYSSVCIAREPCSVIGAVEHFENAEVSDCR